SAWLNRDLTFFLRSILRASCSGLFRLSASPPLRPTATPPRPYRHQSTHHLTSPLEHTARVVVAQDLQRLGQWSPLAGGDPLIYLGTDLAFRTLEQKKVAVLVNVASAEPEVPIDD